MNHVLSHEINKLCNAVLFKRRVSCQKSDHILIYVTSRNVSYEPDRASLPEAMRSFFAEGTKHVLSSMNNVYE